MYEARRRQEKEDSKRLRITRICSADIFRWSRHEAAQRYGVNREGRGEYFIREAIKRERRTQAKERHYSSSTSAATLNKVRKRINRDVSPLDG